MRLRNNSFYLVEGYTFSAQMSKANNNLTFFLEYLNMYIYIIEYASLSCEMWNGCDKVDKVISYLAYL